MGDWFQHVVDLEASLDEAPMLNRQLQAWLVQQGIIESTLSDCALENTGMGYAPGPQYPHIVDATPESIEDTQRLWTNGVAFCVGRTVFDAGQPGVEIFCPACQKKHTDGGDWGAAITDWYEGGVGILACEHCRSAQPITEWIFEPAWGFSPVGCTFWNWPPLKQSFLDEIARVVGHRIRYITGKL